MAELRVRIGITGDARQALRRIAAQAETTILRQMQAITAEVFRRSQLKISGDVVKVRTGHLRRSGFYWAKKVRGGIEGTVGYRATYAEGIEKGTRPHVIRAKGQALRFVFPSFIGPLRFTKRGKLARRQSGGAWAFAKSVQHPGTPPRPFLEPSVDEVVPPTWRERFSRALQELFKRA